jgi:hypothetical protein
LIGAQVPVEARLDPILPGLTDGPDCLDPLCAALARIGVRRIAASVLFLRPAVIRSLRRHVEGKAMLKRMLERFASAEPLAIHAAGSRVRALPRFGKGTVPFSLRENGTVPKLFIGRP